VQFEATRAPPCGPGTLNDFSHATCCRRQATAVIAGGGLGNSTWTAFRDWFAQLAGCCTIPIGCMVRNHQRRRLQTRLHPGKTVPNEANAQDHSLVPADLRDIGHDVPSRPATVLGTRQGATEQQQQQQARRDARERADETGSVPLLQRRGGGGGGSRGGHPAGAGCWRAVEQEAVV
jgi:hypothetical protein